MILIMLRGLAINDEYYLYSEEGQNEIIKKIAKVFDKQNVRHSPSALRSQLSAQFPRKKRRRSQSQKVMKTIKQLEAKSSD